MRIATFNLWHGLSPSNPLAFEELEPSGRRELRYAMQEECLKQIQVDCLLLQEVNPARERSQRLAHVLGFDFQYQPDLTGIKLLGYGPPFNLASGLVILSSQHLRFVKAVQLSGPRFGFAGRMASWQMKESRYALLSEFVSPETGRTLLVNTHLHHGLEATSNFIEEAEKVCQSLELSESAIVEIKERLLAGNVRRELEITRLLEEIDHLQNRYETIVVGGDFNCSAESHVYQQMVEFGFIDGWKELHPDLAGLTFDGEQNFANHKLQERFPISIVLEDLTFSTKAKTALFQLARRQEARPRRIDYCWIKSKSKKTRVQAAELFGQPNAEGLAPSDHFGVMVNFLSEG